MFKPGVFVLVIIQIQSGPNWVDIGILITQILTVVGALLAVLAVRRQIGDSEKHHGERLSALEDEIRRAEIRHREQLAGSARPLVMVQRARMAGTPGAQYLEVDIRNVGVGPAKDVVLLGWPRPLPQTQMSPTDARSHMDSERRQVNLDEPELSLRLGALAPGDASTHPMALNDEDPRVEPDTVRFLIYLAEYRDVFDNEFPSKPRDEWLAGHLMIEQQPSN